MLESFVVFVDFWNMDHDLGTRNQAQNLRLAALYRFVVESSGLDSREPRKVKLKVAHECRPIIRYNNYIQNGHQQQMV